METAQTSTPTQELNEIVTRLRIMRARVPGLKISENTEYFKYCNAISALQWLIRNEMAKTPLDDLDDDPL